MLTITVYTTGPCCGRCLVTKRALDKKGITYREVNIRENPAAREYVTEELGYSEAPVCVVEDGTGEDHWSGFRPDEIERVAAARNATAGYERPPPIVLLEVTEDKRESTC